MAESTDPRDPQRESERDRRLSRSLRTTVLLAVEEAQRRNAPTVEAEHLLLALALPPETPAQRALVRAGLDHAGVEAALRAEREAGLRAAGVEPVPEERLRAAPRPHRPRWGASAREALVAAHRAAAGHRGGHPARTVESDLLAGILDLQLGTVPRALAIAGIDLTTLRTP
jgi:ATP-dependent Clp protease ATP-binding subunit ClpA